jgi:hypothetical protein
VTHLQQWPEHHYRLLVAARTVATRRRRTNGRVEWRCIQTLLHRLNFKALPSGSRRAETTKDLGRKADGHQP